MTKVTAHILQPNCPMIPNVDYSFDIPNLNSINEFKEGLYKYLRFNEKKNITDEISGVFPDRGGKLNKAYPKLEFKPEDSYFYEGMQYYKSCWPAHMMELIPPNMKLQSMPKKRMLVMKQINIYAWQVLIF